MIYLAYCTKCGKQGIGSTENWKPRLSDYKSHIKKNVKSCSIMKHFIYSCTDTVNSSKYLRFIQIDCVTNTENSSIEEIDDLLLEKENFWIGTLCTIHKGLNDYHDWRRVRSLISMIGKIVIKFAWMFPELDFFGKLKPVSNYFLTGFHMRNRFSSRNVLIRNTFLEIILSVFLKYIFYVFIVIHC